MAGANSNNGTGFRRSRGVNWTEVTLYLYTINFMYNCLHCILFVCDYTYKRKKQSICWKPGQIEMSNCCWKMALTIARLVTLHFQEYTITLKTMFVLVYKVI